MSRARIVLVTGTDTGVGKTWVGCALARALARAGTRVVAIKPVETGCGPLPGPEEDGVRLAAAAGQRTPRQALRRFRDPVTPALAAERDQATLDFDALVGEVERHAAGHDVALVEGAGGLLAPIGWDWNAADLAEALGARALVVACDRLGTINHTLLTLGAVELAGILPLGVVLTPPAAPDESTGTNLDAIRRCTGLERLLAAPRTDDADAAADALRPLLDWLAP